MTQSLQLFSTVSSDGRLNLELKTVEMKQPEAGEVLIEIQAAPINPSDMWPMFGPADLSTMQLKDEGDELRLTADVPKNLLSLQKARLDQSLAVGNEGAGVVVAAGEGAEQLIGRTVGFSSGNCYAQYTCVPAMTCLPLHEGTTAEQGASSFVNPLTALGMVETMRLEGHTALVHTAAASNLGQMLNKICIADKVALVNIVRSQKQVDILKGIGASYIVNSSDADYYQQLYAAIDATGATLAFDATGGGQLASDILMMMEQVLSKDAVGLNTYGSEQLKQVYLYGGLDTSPTMLNRAYGMSWAVGGWLLPRFMQRIGMQRVAELQKRVADEIDTTFASHFTKELSLREAINPDNVKRYIAKKTGEKYFVNPSA